MGKPNYQFEKRRRELEKKAKKDEKLKRKSEAVNAPDGSAIVEETPLSENS